MIVGQMAVERGGPMAITLCQRNRQRLTRQPNCVADTPDPKLSPKENWYAPPANKPELREE